jgi:tripartite-type tricarboxylate transporter receptor subunit TctC
MRFLRLIFVGFGFLAAGPTAAADFYQGKTLTVIVGYAPGGGVDTTARVVTRHLGRFIPGNPTVAVQNMEGAAGIVSLNHLVRRVSPDGLTLGIPGRSWFVEGIVKRPGVVFDPVTLTYVGSPGSVTSAAYLRTATGIKTFDELKASGKPVSFGALGAGSHTATVPGLLAAAGAPIKVVLGYVSTARILLALEQGEIDGSFTTGDGLANRTALVKQVTPIVQSAARNPGLPLIRDVIRVEHRPLLDLVLATDTFGVPIVGPPGIPAEQTAILRKAFVAMAEDKDYQADARRVELPVGHPIEGGKLAEMMRALAQATTPDVIAEFQKLAAGK